VSDKLTADELLATVRVVAARVGSCDKDALGVDDDLMAEHGFDSLSMVEIFLFLEDSLASVGMKVFEPAEEEDFIELTSIRRIAEYVARTSTALESGQPTPNDAIARVNDTSLRLAALIGDEFRLVDRVVTESADAIQTAYFFHKDTPWLKAHFLKESVVPGSLLQEMICQSALELALRKHPDSSHYIITKIKASFSRLVRPSCEVLGEVRITSQSDSNIEFEGRCIVAAREIARFAVSARRLNVPS
jgi:3-hydroxymyristoyl/3-hydroxydecanoyl-(acyl carrier protein) dehydratase